MNKNCKSMSISRSANKTWRKTKGCNAWRQGACAGVGANLAVRYFAAAASDGAASASVSLVQWATIGATALAPLGQCGLNSLTWIGWHAAGRVSPPAALTPGGHVTWPASADTMPGLVVFKRRWSVGSDDLVVPGVFLFLLHTIWWVTFAPRAWNVSLHFCKPMSSSESRMPRQSASNEINSTQLSEKKLRKIMFRNIQVKCWFYNCCLPHYCITEDAFHRKHKRSSLCLYWHHGTHTHVCRYNFDKIRLRVTEPDVMLTNRSRKLCKGRKLLLQSDNIPTKCSKHVWI